MNIKDNYIIKNNKKLACGYTTGSCAAAAAKAAAVLLLQGIQTDKVSLMTPGGIRLHLEAEYIVHDNSSAEYAVKKDSGDDPDITNGMRIHARVGFRAGTGIEIRGGRGIGTVTRKGLEQPPGAPAINKVPRAMIRQAVEEVCEISGCEGGLYAEISAPGGEELAAQTFNPKLGIEGGISILGTSGIVEPMSEKAILDTIFLEMKMRRAAGETWLLVTPGNYGAKFVKEHLELSVGRALKCSNFIGEVIDEAVNLEYEGILFVSHIGKFIKVSGGIMNTHSRNADARLELLAAHALYAGADHGLLKKVLACATTDAALELLQDSGCLTETMKRMMEQIEKYLGQRSYKRIKTGAVVFSNQHGELGRTTGIDQLLHNIREQQEKRIDRGNESET